MPGRQLRTVLHFLRQVSDFSSAAQQSDGQLLQRFIDRRDAAAFAVLVQRHGPLVLSVCRRVLSNLQDAEDAFQATFLVLVRKARSIAQHESVGSWLHGVARRIAVRAKGDIARRRASERQAPRLPPPDTLHEVVWRDLRAMIDEEVLRLPARCREPFVLCYLEGRTNEEAAQRLGCPKGTVQSRMARARELLRVRLARRGLVVSASLVATLLPSGANSAAVSAALVKATVSAAGLYAAGRALPAGAVSAKVIALTEGVLQAMFLTKLKIATTLMAVVGVVGLTAGVPAYQMFGVGQVEGKQEARSQGSVEIAGGIENETHIQPPAQDEKKAPEAGKADQEAQTRVYGPFKYVRAAHVAAVLKEAALGSGRLSLGTDDRTNRVHVAADPETHKKIAAIIQKLDVPPEKKAQAEQTVLKLYTLKHLSPEQAKAVIEQLSDPKIDLKVFVWPSAAGNSLLVGADQATQDRVAAILQKVDVPPEKKPQEPPAPRPQLPEGVGPPPVAAAAPLDLVNLASAYIDAVRSRELARLRVERVEKLKGAISNEEAATARIDLQTAERKVALLRSIAEAACEGAQSELKAVKSRHQVGQALANQVAAAEAKVKMLKSILDSAK